MLNLTPDRWRSLFNRLEKPVTALFITLGLASVGFAQPNAYGSQQQPIRHQGAIATAQNPAAQRLPNGTYLYGQATQPNRMGSAYMVFEVTNNRVIGAFYMPSSSFDCFYGELNANQLALNVVDSYEQTVHPYNVAVDQTAPVAGTRNEVAPVSFEGFHRLPNLSDLDRNILNTCKTDRQQAN